eukprot:CAMPEP_0185372836 /NCGR_PEP_ID=MMETSP1364-20130426/25626_1 /TAXON_ID=38817 /ORGANISM="Gephyrocapsa oceanica, Strain RCC1303" /LENGTH=160 /DNA_ID=CAMNT_0027973811 /DNA_START=267 /DNA_END=745 /DNA_ORIENTATION=+
MEEAAAELQQAGERAEIIARLRAEAESKLAEIEANQKKGRPKKEVTAKKAALHRRLNLLDRNVIPGEAEKRAAAAKKSAEQLAADARDNAPHHAAPTQLSSTGRPAATRPARDGGPAAAHGRGTGGDAAGGDTSGGDAAAAEEDDDDAEDAAFRQYYKVT